MTRHHDPQPAAAGTRRASARWAAITAASLLVGLGLVVSALFSGSSRNRDTTGDHLCVVWGTRVETPRDLCERVSADTAGRSRISESQRAVGEAAFARVERALGLLGRCYTDHGMPCAREHEPRAPSQADADRLKQDMTSAGFSRNTARIATTEDAAPHGSLLYAIQVDDRTCVIGYLNRVPLGLSGHDVVGPLPGGGCLTA